MVRRHLYRIYVAYEPIFHHVVSPVLCVVGIVTNCLNILILSTKRMKSPMNVLLQWLAAADGLAMINFLIFSIHYHYLDENNMGALSTIQTQFVCVNAATLFHNIAIWLAVALAMFRSLVVSFPLHAGRLCTFSRVHITTVIISILMTAASVPTMYMITIQAYNFTGTDNTTTSRHYPVLRSSFYNLSAVMHSVTCNLLPYFLLLVLNVVLIKGMSHAGRRHLELTSTSTNSCGGNRSQHNSRSTSSDGNSSSTGILVAIVTLSILTETPQGVILFWSGFDEDVLVMHALLADLLNTLTLINSTVNFLLYCTMSRKFRKTFMNMMRKAMKPRLLIF